MDYKEEKKSEYSKFKDAKKLEEERKKKEEEQERLRKLTEETMRITQEASLQQQMQQPIR